MSSPNPSEAMSPIGRVTRGAAAGVVALAVVAAVGNVRAENPYQALKLFTEVLELVKERYVEEIRRDLLTMDGLKGLLDNLDNYSLYLEKLDHRRHLHPGPLSFSRLGICVGLRGGRLVVVSPVPSSQAAKAGILPGDVIAEVDGVTTVGMSLREALASLVDKDEVDLLLWRNSLQRTLRIRLKAESPESEPYEVLLQGEVGYLEPGWIERGTARRTADKLRRLLQKGARAFILDLRSSPGEELIEAATIADSFVGSDLVLGYTIDRDRSQRTYYRSHGQPLAGTADVIVLVGPGTCCAGEMLASALKELGRAVLIGGETFGKGTLQEVVELSPEAGVVLTRSRWYTPAGTCLDRNLGGWDPDKSDAPPRAYAGVTPHLAVSPEWETPMEAFLRASGLLRVRGRGKDEIPQMLSDHGFLFLPTERQVDSALAVPGNSGVPIFALQDKAAAIQRIAIEMDKQEHERTKAARLRADPLVREALEILADADRYRSLLAAQAQTHS